MRKENNRDKGKPNIRSIIMMTIILIYLMFLEMISMIFIKTQLTLKKIKNNHIDTNNNDENNINNGEACKIDDNEKSDIDENIREESILFFITKNNIIA